MTDQVVELTGQAQPLRVHRLRGRLGQVAVAVFGDAPARGGAQVGEDDGDHAPQGEEHNGGAAGATIAQVLVAGQCDRIGHRPGQGQEQGRGAQAPVGLPADYGVQAGQGRHNNGVEAEADRRDQQEGGVEDQQGVGGGEDRPQAEQS